MPERGESDELKRQTSEIRAACILGNSSLIVLRNPTKSDLVLFEYAIHVSANTAVIRKGRKIGQLRLSQKTAGELAISAFHNQDGGTTVVVAGQALNGNIEVATGTILLPFGL